MNLEIYKVRDKIEIDPPIRVIVKRRRIAKPRVGETEFYQEEAELYYSSGLAWDKSIIFLARNKKENFAINESQIVSLLGLNKK